MKRRLLALIGASVVVSAVAGAVAQPSPQPPADTQPQQQLSPEDQARRAKVVARVGDSQITVGDVEDAINSQSPFLRLRYRDPERLRDFVKNMIRFELLAAEAERRHYGDHPNVVRTVKQNAVQQLIRSQFDERITPETVPEEDVREYYQTHEDEFNRPEMVRASHILVNTEEEARELLPQAREADARAFRQLAREHSIDTETKLRGGDLRFFTVDGRPPGSQDAAVDPAIVTAAFELHDIGDVVSAPVRVGDHWSVIKLTGRRPAETRTLEQAAQGIRLRLWRERRQQAIDTFVDGLRERLHPEIHADRMNAIHLEPVSPQAGFGGHGERSSSPTPTPAPTKEPAKQPASGTP